LLKNNFQDFQKVCKTDATGDHMPSANAARTEIVFSNVSGVAQGQAAASPLATPTSSPQKNAETPVTAQKLEV
jgi:hypothetical protein